MKELKRLGLVAILGLGMISCGNDDDSSSNAGLEGLWKVESITITGLPDGLPDEIKEIIESSLEDECITKNTLNFNSGTVIAKSYSGENCLEEEVETDTYTKDGNTLTIISEGEEQETTIKTLTSETLRLELNLEDEDMGVEVKPVMTLKRQ